MKAIISKNIRVRYPDNFEAGEYSIIDDFSYFSTKVKVGRFSHIASGCLIAGGKEWQFEIGDYSSISSGAKIWCTSNDYSNDVVTFIPPGIPGVTKVLKEKMISGDVKISNFTAIGSNAVVMPNNIIPEGTVIGALSFVPPNFKFKKWSVYAGIPIRFIKKRNRKNVLKEVRLIEDGIKKYYEK